MWPTMQSTPSGPPVLHLPSNPHAPQSFTPRVVEATTWLLLADLMRRHERALGLRIAETHPGGGQYDCRTLFRPTEQDFGQLVSFNLQSGNAHLFEPTVPGRRLPDIFGADPDGQRLAYVAAALSEPGRRPVRKWIEARLGLDRQGTLPLWTQHALTYAVMAGVAARFALIGPRVRWENGLEDTSGWPSDDPVRQEVRAVPALAARLEAGGTVFARGRHPAQAAWVLMVGDDGWHSPKAVAVLSTDAVMRDLAAPAVAIDLFARFQASGRVRSAADVVESLVYRQLPT